MKVIGLDGQEYNWKPSGNHGKRSHLHQRAKDLLRTMYPYDNVMEEVSLTGTGKPPLRADIYLPSRNLIVEVHGEQHFVFNKHFYSTRADFLRAKSRDLKKIEWCTINDIRIVHLRFDESDKEWEEKLC